MFSIILVNFLRHTNNQPVNWEDGDFFSGFAVDVLALDAEVEPGLADEVDCLSNIQAR